MKKIVLSLTTIFLASCGVASNVNNSNQLKNVDISEISAKNNILEADMGTKGGAEFKIDVKISDGFKTKASVSGAVEKKLTDIAKVDVYLLSLTSAPTAGSNPLGVANANVLKSFTGATSIAKTGGSISLLFKGVPGLATNQYFVGVVLKDSGSAVINKAPGTPWTLDTLTTAPSLTVSSSGVGVDPTTLAVSTTTSLSITASLLDAIGAQIDSTTTTTAGTNGLTNGAVTVQ
ncbi:MAG: hypothetical protein AABZ74_16670 [Cyanobacteriota bacterium]